MERGAAGWDASLSEAARDDLARQTGGTAAWEGTSWGSVLQVRFKKDILECEQRINKMFFRPANIGNRKYLSDL